MKIHFLPEVPLQIADCIRIFLEGPKVLILPHH
mgnify:CR=1 FL=1